jgi:hypothetical protein
LYYPKCRILISKIKRRGVAMVDILKRKKALKEKLREITKRKISPTCFVVQDKSRNFEEIRTNYDEKKFGFSAGKFVLISQEPETLALVVGVGIDVDENDGNEELWFLIEGKDGIAYWKGNRADDFSKAGFVLLIL